MTRRRVGGPSGGAKVALGVLLLGFCVAPTPGDIGGCGQAPEELDPGVFFATKKNIDCERCRECGLRTERCDEACDSATATETEFPDGCVPLVHDGEVCLRALMIASCDDYATYVTNAGASAPSECNFCPPRTGSAARGER